MGNEIKPEAYPDDYDELAALERLESALTEAAHAAYIAREVDGEKRQAWIDHAGKKLDRAKYRLEALE